MNPLILRRLAIRRKVTAVSSSAGVASPSGSLQGRRLTLGVMFLAFTYVFLANAWIGDDAYITFRVVWNFVHGYGLTFNPDERVQAFTHPLWTFVIAAVHSLT